jgi:hypothetical protein
MEVVVAKFKALSWQLRQVTKMITEKKKYKRQRRKWSSLWLFLVRCLVRIEAVTPISVTWDFCMFPSSLSQKLGDRKWGSYFFSEIKRRKVWYNSTF